MTDYTDLDWYDDLVAEFGPVTAPRFPTEKDLQKWRGRLPDLLLRFWQEQGWGGNHDGKYWVCNPDVLRPVIDEVFAGDPEFEPSDLIPIGYNAFGVIDIFMGRGRTMSLDLPYAISSWRDDSFNTYTGKPESDFSCLYSRISLGAFRIDRNAETGAPMFPWAVEKLGPLGPNEIYGLVPAYAMTQRIPLENLRKLPVVEHLVFLAGLQAPTLYQYSLPTGDQGGFGSLTPLRRLGPQTP